MWSFRLNSKKNDSSAHGSEAAAAIERAQASIDEVRERRPEVRSFHDQLVSRRLKNNFGPSLELALAKRSSALD